MPWSDFYDNVLSETLNGLYKAELVHSQRMRGTMEAVELATVGGVRWWNTACLHEALIYRTPVEDEAAYTCGQVFALHASSLRKGPRGVSS